MRKGSIILKYSYHPSISTYLPTYYLPTYLPTCLPTYIYLCMAGKQNMSHWTTTDASHTHTHTHTHALTHSLTHSLFVVSLL